MKNSKVDVMPKYGKRLRDMKKKVDRKAKKKYECPSCNRIAVKRKASGIWECRKCGAKFASKAYSFKKPIKNI